jgi:hypothetical protein
MNKLISTIIFFAITLTSCQKNYTCTCVNYVIGAGGKLVPTTTVANTIHDTKKRATTDCTNESTDTPGYPYICTLN